MAVSLFYGNEDHTFDQQMHEAHKEADQILSQHGLCTAQQECYENHVSIFNSGNAARFSNGFNVEIYGTTDQKLLGEISQTFINQFNITPEMERISIIAYAPTRHQVGNHSLSKQSAILDIDMRRRIKR